MNYETASIAQITTECARLTSSAAVATATRQRLRREHERTKDDFFGASVSEADVQKALQEEIAAETNANRCQAALARRKAGKKPDPSTRKTATAKSGPVFTVGSTPASSGPMSIGAAFNANPGARSCGSGGRGKCLDKRRFSTITNGSFLRGKCPGAAHIQCLYPSSGGTSFPPVSTGGGKPAKPFPVTTPEPEVLPEKKKLALPTNISPTIKVAGLFVLPIAAALAYKAWG